MTDIGWRYHPAATVAITYAIGIGAAFLCKPPAEALLTLLALTLLVAVVDAVRLRILYPYFLFLTVLLTGALSYVARYDAVPEIGDGIVVERMSVVGVVDADPVRTASGFRWEMRVDSISYRNVISL